MKSNYKKLAEFITPAGALNNGMEVDNLLGISNAKYFQKAKTNIIGIDLEKYRIVRKGQFAFNRATTRNGDKISIALREESDCIVSPSYRIFEVIKTDELIPEYLMMWFRRPEFDRYARYKSHGSAHEFFEYENMCEVKLPIPSIDKQKEIVKEYHTITDRIKLNEELNQKLEDTAQSIYKEWFVNFEFPDENGKPYKSNGGELVYCDELDMEIPKGWHFVGLETIALCLDNMRKPLSSEERDERKGIYPYYGAMSIVDYVNEYIYDGIHILVSEDGANVVDEKGRPSVQYVWNKFWVNNHAHVLKGKNGISTEFLMLALQRENVAHLVTGAAQPKINQKNLMSLQFVLPPQITINKFSNIVNPIFRQYRNSIELINFLEKLNEVLLSKMATIED